MKQQPSRVFYRKPHKPASFFLTAAEQKSFYPLRGLYALKSLGSGRLTVRQIEAGRRTIRRTVAKKGLVVIRTFTYASLTKRPVGLRMGKGKGAHSVWVCPIRTGQIIYELCGISDHIA